MRDKRLDAETTLPASRFYKEREYWQQKLSGKLVKSRFIYDNSRKKPDHHLLEELKFSFDGDLCSRAMRLANQSDLRLFMILTTGLSLLLYRYTASKDIIVGTTIGKQKIDGYFINTILPLRIQFDDNITLKELLLQVKNTVQEAIENQNYPLDTLLSDLNLDDFQEDFPLFDIAILLENIHDKRYLSDTKPDVLFSFVRRGENIEGDVTYNSSLYHKSTIERIVRHFTKLLGNALCFFDHKVSEIEILSEEERQQILFHFNSTPVDIPEKKIFELIEEQTQMIPGDIALRSEGSEITYQQFNHRANQLARVLRQCGIQNDQPVGISLHRSSLMMECIMAVWKAGGAYIPIDPQYPPKRVTGILKDSKTKVLLTRSEYLNREIEENYEGHVIALDLRLNDIRTEDRENLNLDIGMNDLAYIIYTSGSTGKPKGVMVEHIGMMNHMQAKIKDFEITSASIIAQNASHTFDISIWQFFAALMAGGQTVIYPKELVLDAQQFISNVIENNITILEVVPSYLSIMLDCLDTSFKEFKTLKYLLVTGEELKPILAKRWLQKYPGIKIANAYGPTEASDDITHYIFARIPEYERIPIGKPLQNFNIYITDGNMNLCPIGVEGEICVSGIGVGRGYLYDENKTKQVFINDPFRNEDGQKVRLFKTGDLGRWLPDGNIEFFGRKDYQVKIRGFRIELGEIESTLLNHDDIKEAVVIDRDDEKGNKYLCAYLAANKKLDVSKIKEYLLEILPDYMIPSHFVELDQIPLTPNGKVDREALPEPTSESDPRLIYLTEEELKTVTPQLIEDTLLRYFIEETMGKEHELTEKEKEQLLYSFNNSSCIFPKDKSLVELFEEKVEKNPGKIAVVYENGGLTYKELNRKANQLARVLRLKGVKEDIIVGFLLDNSFELIIVILGILKAGGAYLPIDSWYPEARRNYMIKHSSTKFLITQRQYMDTFAYGNDCEIIDIEGADLFKGNDENFKISNWYDNLFYVTFTSGTTGKPKGAGVQHCSFLNHMIWFIHEFKFTVNDNVLLLTSIAFDLTQKSIFTPLLTGGKLIFPSFAYIEAEALLQQIWDNHISWVNCTPSIFYKLLEFSNSDDMKKLALLRYVLFGGESISLQPLKEWIESDYFNAEIVNTYGVTECAGISAYYRIKDPFAFESETIPLGKPISNCQLYVLDKEFSPVPIGTTGELFIAGEGVGIGYLNDILLSHERFINISLEKNLNKLLYRTGDYAKWLPDGNIQFLGRIDDQVNIEGIRIELEDIESRLLAHDDIKEAAVVEKQKKNGDIILGACFVSERNFSILELREYLSRELPLFMIPSYFIQLEKMPLTPNGKIDKKVLRAIDIEIGMDTDHVGPGDEIEEKLVKIWEEVLGIEGETIGINTDFFELGGHSLKVTILVARMHKEFNVKIPLTVVFEKPTVKGLAEYVKETTKVEYESIDSVEEKEYFELSSAQKRLYILSQMDRNSTTFNIPAALVLEGSLDKDRLKDTFLELIRRHESLRTSFELAEDRPVQRVHKQVTFELPIYDLPPGKSEKEIIEGFEQPFDLSLAPLLRAGLIKLPHTPTALRGHPSQEGKEDKYLLMVDLHHIISDGISQGILVKDFMRLYTGEELPGLRLHYKDYAEWQNSEAQKEKVKNQEKYWLKQFEGEVPVLNLPLDYERPPLMDFEGHTIRCVMQAEITGALEKIALDENATLYMMLLSICYVWISKICGQDDILIGLTTAGRNHSDLEPIVGAFINTLVSRNQPHGEKSFRQFLWEVKTKTLEIFENQDYQFEDLVSKLGFDRDPGRNPLFNAAFGMWFDETLSDEIPKMQIPGLKLSPYEYETRKANFDLLLFCMKKGDEVELLFEYCMKLFKSETIERFITYFKKIVSAVLDDFEQKIKEIDIVSAEEKEEILSMIDIKEEDMQVDFDV